jgi:hypothetical protein
VTSRRLKLILLLAGLALSGLVFLGWTQSWFAISIVNGPTLSIGGDTAAPALSTLALTCIVLNAALSIAGPFFRVVLGALEALLGVAVLFSGILALADPAKSSAAAISNATGVAGAESIAALIASVSIFAWPWVATIAGALLVLLGGIVVATGRRWPGAGRKYNAIRMTPSEKRDSVDDWDALSGGDDPT